MNAITAREFNRDVSAAKRAADDGPVVITDRGQPAYVLMSIADYERLQGDGRDLVSRLAMVDEVEFEPARLDLGFRPVDL